MYEAMVKEAYENILGFEKEAKKVLGPYGYVDEHGSGDNKVSRPYYQKTLENKAKRDAVVGAVKKPIDAYINALKGKDLKDIAAQRKSIREALPGVDSDTIKDALKSQNVGGKEYGSALAKTVGAYAVPTLAVAGTALAAKKLHDKKKAKAQAALEAAEAQKEAAENDYMEACAYEEAALEVLAELGYDVDEMLKEASEDDGMSVEEMDQAAFEYLESRGYFDED